MKKTINAARLQTWLVTGGRDRRRKGEGGERERKRGTDGRAANKSLREQHVLLFSAQIVWKKEGYEGGTIAQRHHVHDCPLVSPIGYIPESAPSGLKLTATEEGEEEEEEEQRTDSGAVCDQSP